MGIEIERKFLVSGDGWRREVQDSVSMVQGYLPATPPLTLRTRLAGTRAKLTLKGPAEAGVRAEFEYDIPVADAEELLQQFAGDHVIRKTRHRVPGPEGLTWEIDEFDGALAGHFLAELEMPSAEFEFVPPKWVGRDVTDDLRYSNQWMSEHGWPPA